jgi:hypothetical protein
MHLWLDDIREVPEIYENYPVRDETGFGMNTYIVYKVKSVNGAITSTKSAIDNNRYDGYLFDLDHDLGDYAKDGGDAIKFIDWLVENYHDKNMNFKFRFHSMNPVGVENMKNAVSKYWAVC